MKFPVICVDNFYKDPDKVREFALSQNFNMSSSEWPGKRTKPLAEINVNFFHSFCRKLIYLYYDHNPGKIGWEVQSSFQIVESYSNEEFSPKNVGWIHQDVEWDLGGIIYLTPDVNKNSGTSIFKLVDDDKINWDGTKQQFYGVGLDLNYDELLVKHNSAFEETARFYNCYNRLVSFDSSVPHGVNTFFTENEPRLTQVFFAREVANPNNPPVIRSNMYSDL